MINNAAGIELSEVHVAVVNRRRRAIVNFDASWHVDTFGEDVTGSSAEASRFANDEGSDVDGISWSWGRGRTAAYPAKTLPSYDRDKYRQWIKQGETGRKLLKRSKAGYRKA